MNFLKKMNKLKIATDSKNVVECDRNSKSSQNVQNLIFLKKIDESFHKKHEFLKIAKYGKDVVECNWNITISQNVPFFPKNWWTFWEKMNNIKIGKCSKVVTECDRNSKSSQKVQKLIFSKKIRWVFPEKTWIFENR